MSGTDGILIMGGRDVEQLLAGREREIKDLMMRIAFNDTRAYISPHRTQRNDPLTLPQQ